MHSGGMCLCDIPAEGAIAMLQHRAAATSRTPVPLDSTSCLRYMSSAYALDIAAHHPHACQHVPPNWLLATRLPRTCRTVIHALNIAARQPHAEVLVASHQMLLATSLSSCYALQCNMRQILASSISISWHAIPKCYLMSCLQEHAAWLCMMHTQKFLLQRHLNT